MVRGVGFRLVASASVGPVNVSSNKVGVVVVFMKNTFKVFVFVT